MIVGGRQGKYLTGATCHGEDGRRNNDFSATTRKLLSKVCLGLILTAAGPSSGNAMWLLSDSQSVAEPLLAGPFGSPFGSAPYFNSASAARLLVDPASSVRGNTLTHRQLAQQKAIQDSRLQQCYDSGIDWEQCFYYGTGGRDQGTPAPMTLPFVGNRYLDPGHRPANERPTSSKTKVPTW